MKRICVEYYGITFFYEREKNCTSSTLDIVKSPQKGKPTGIDRVHADPGLAMTTYTCSQSSMIASILMMDRLPVLPHCCSQAAASYSQCHRRPTQDVHPPVCRA